MDFTDTIVAPATPRGRSAVALVRMTGPQAFSVAATLVAPRAPGRPGKLVRRVLRDAAGRAMDEAMVVFFAAPLTVTGEDVVELHLHGSPVLVEMVMDACLRQGVRLARPGEFTLRAFVNGRRDLSQAEAVADLVDARTGAGVRLAAARLSDGAGPALAPAAGLLLDLASALEAEIDFPEDVAPMAWEAVCDRLERAEALLLDLVRSHDRAVRLKEGFRVVLAGAPNAGKSSLFNALLGRDRALVTPEAGTTRDFIEELIAGHGVPVLLVDTAGIAASTSAAEQAGIRRAVEQAGAADLVCLVQDGTRAPGPEDHAAADAVRGRPVVTVRTRADLLPPVHGTSVVTVRTRADLLPPAERTTVEDPVESPADGSTCLVSNLTGEGVDVLRQKLLAAAAAAGGADGPVALTSLRQKDLCRQALEWVQGLRSGPDLPRDVLSTGVRQALGKLNEVTGKGPVDKDVLDAIFSTFCLGK
jgi:tRNA modification GTPase